MAQPYPEPEQVIKWYYSQPEQMQSIEMAVLEDQVVDHVLAAASVDVLKSSYTDIVSGATMPKTEEETEADAGAEEAEAATADETDADTDKA